MVEQTSGTAMGGKSEMSRTAFYEQVRSNLRAALDEQHQIELDLDSLNQEIDVLETKYRKETPAGNLVIGFENYVRTVTSTAVGVGGPGGGRRKGNGTDLGSFFNRVAQESVGHKNGTMLMNGNGATKGNKKRKSLLIPDTDEDGKPIKRGKLTYARE